MSADEPTEPARPVRTERCAGCGYDVTVLPTSAHCPECGNASRIAYVDGVPEGDSPDLVLLRYRPVTRTLVAGGLLCLATSVIVPFSGSLQNPVVSVAIGTTMLAAFLLLVVAPIWAAVIAVRHSRATWGSYSNSLIARHVVIALGTAFTVAATGFLIGVMACSPIILISG